MTALDGAPIGFVTWNPTRLSESAEIGHNCVCTSCEEKGYSKRQMREAVGLVPAQRAYESAGFRLIRRSEELFCPGYAGQRLHDELIADSHAKTE